MHPDLDCLKGTETNVGQELGRGGGSQVETGLPSFGVFLSHKARIEVLEKLIASILHRTLNGVAEESWAPASENSSDALSPAYLSPGLEIALVEIRVDLAPAFDEIERSDRGMSGSLTIVRRLTTPNAIGNPTQARMPPTTHAA